MNEFNLNLILKTDEIIKSWNIVKKLITDDFIADHPDYDFEAFGIIDSYLDIFKNEMEMCAVGEMNYTEGTKELKHIRELIYPLMANQIDMVSISENININENIVDDEKEINNDDIVNAVEDEDNEKSKAQEVLNTVINNMRSKGVKVDQVFPQGE